MFGSLMIDLGGSKLMTKKAWSSDEMHRDLKLMASSILLIFANTHLLLNKSCLVIERLNLFFCLHPLKDLNLALVPQLESQ